MYFQVQNSNYIQVKRSSRKQVPGAYRLEVEFVDTLRADRRSALFPVSLGFPLSFFFSLLARILLLHSGRVWARCTMAKQETSSGREHNTRLILAENIILV